MFGIVVSMSDPDSVTLLKLLMDFAINTGRTMCTIVNQRYPFTIALNVILHKLSSYA